MRRTVTWVLIGCTAAVALAATLDALLFDDSDASAPATTRPREASSGAGTTTRDIPRCERGQLRLAIAILAGTPIAALEHVQGGPCETENLPIRVAIRDRQGRVLGPRGAFGGPSLPNSQQSVQFQYSPACQERGPFVAVVRAGPYTAERRIPVLRCGL